MFLFLEYVKPIWYLNLRPGHAMQLVDYNKLADEEKSLLNLCSEYSTSSASMLDAAIQAWFKGFIETDSTRSFRDTSTCVDVNDNYLFLRRFFNPGWSWYALMVRLCTFNNPFVEIPAFYRHRHVPRLDLYEQTRSYSTIDTAQVDGARAMVSVIIPTLNRYKYLEDVLRDLENQNYKPFEVIVVDQSDVFDSRFYDKFLIELVLIRQEEKALWKARNTAIRRARGELLLLFDDDSRVGPDWIARHADCIEYFKADLSAGVSLSAIGSKVPRTYSYYKWSDQVDTGNVMIKRSVFEKVGLFDRQFEGQRMGDAEFGMRCYLAGLRNVSNPNASRIHLKVGEGGLREMGSWDAFRPKKFLGPRPVPSVLYYFRKYFGSEAAAFALIKDIPLSMMPYRHKGNKTLTLMGIVLSIFLAPVVAFQVYEAWRLSGIKLREGDRIERL